MVSVAAVLAAGDVDQAAALLPGLASGERIATPAWPREGEPLPLLAGGALTGAVRYVPFAQAANLFILACDNGQGLCLVALPSDAPGVTVARHR